MYQYKTYKVSPPNQPEKQVKVEAMDGERGAARKGKMLLVHQGIITREVHPDNLIVREG